MSLKPQQLAVIDLMLEGHTLNEIGKTIGAAKQTIWRWRQDPVFKEELERKRESRIPELRARVEGAGHQALDVLIEVMNDPTASCGNRVRAAVAVLNRCGMEVQKDVQAEETVTVTAPREGESAEAFLTRLTALAKKPNNTEAN